MYSVGPRSLHGISRKHGFAWCTTARRINGNVDWPVHERVHRHPQDALHTLTNFERPAMTPTSNRQSRTDALIKRLEASGVQVEQLPSGAARLYGQHGAVITTSDVLNLRQHEIDRLCRD